MNPGKRINEKSQNKFLSYIDSLEESISKIEKKEIPFKESINFADFKSTERKYVLEMYKRNFNRIYSLSKNDDIPQKITELINQMKLKDIETNKKILQELKKFDNIEIKEKKGQVMISRVPEEVRQDIKADLEEMQKCFDNECYRSAVIICGRIIEVCLHAKYYKVTGFDILEKNPGIGLGKLIAKMDEKGIKLMPGLSQQVHLVNNVRIFSVHKKQRTFIPTTQQTEAIILLTVDLINNLF